MISRAAIFNQTGGVPPAQYLVDLYPDISIASGIQKLKSSQDSPYRVKRISDGEISDVYFDGDRLTGNSLMEVGGTLNDFLLDSDIEVVRAYNAGTGDDFLPRLDEDGSRPLLAVGGVLNIQDGHVCLYNDSNNPARVFIISDSPFDFETGGGSIFAVIKQSGDGTNNQNLFGCRSAANTNQINVEVRADRIVSRLRYGGSSTNYDKGNTDQITSPTFLYSNTIPQADPSTYQQYNNLTEIIGSTSPGVQVGVNGFHLFNNGDAARRYGFIGWQMEIVSRPSQSDFSTIQADILTRYGITP